MASSSATPSTRADLQDGADPRPPLLPDLLEHIQKGDLNPEIIISHRLNLSDAAEGYRLFDKAEDDCRKVILRP